MPNRASIIISRSKESSKEDRVVEVKRTETRSSWAQQNKDVREKSVRDFFTKTLKADSRDSLSHEQAERKANEIATIYERNKK